MYIEEDSRREDEKKTQFHFNTSNYIFFFQNAVFVGTARGAAYIVSHKLKGKTHGSLNGSELGRNTCNARLYIVRKE